MSCAFSEAHCWSPVLFPESIAWNSFSLTHSIHVMLFFMPSYLLLVMNSWLKEPSLETDLCRFVKELVWRWRNQPLLFTQGYWGPFQQLLTLAPWVWRRNLISETNLVSVPFKKFLLFPLLLIYKNQNSVLFCFMNGRMSQGIQWILNILVDLAVSRGWDTFPLDKEFTWQHSLV